MAQRGGYRPGSGRKKKIEEERITKIAISAIQKKFGSLEQGFEFLIGSGEPSLIKLGFEYAFGKPQNKMDVTSSGLPISEIHYIVPGENDSDLSTE